MKTLALRFGEYFSPPEGTICAHEEIIKKYGFVWYGKTGTPVSNMVIQQIMSNDKPQILLIRSGYKERYWAEVQEIQREIPAMKYIPEYYQDRASYVKIWFKISKFTLAPDNILDYCIIASSRAKLSIAIKHTSTPHFIIEVK